MTLNIIPLSASDAEFTFDVDGVEPGGFQVNGFQATEAISELFTVELQLGSTHGGRALAELVGRDARLTLVHALGQRHFHGILRRIHVAGRGLTHTRYSATLVPRAWLLGLRQDSRIFQAMSTPEILTEVLEGVGVSGDALRLSLAREYSPRDFCVQYGETDLAFAQRLMEEEGIFFYFEHSADGHVLVLGDDPIACGPNLDSPIMQFRPPAMSDSADQHVQRVNLGRSVRSGRVTLRDYTFKAPTTDLERVAEFMGTGDAGEDVNADLERYAYPGDYVDGDLGADLAQIRLEEQQVQRQLLSGESDIRRLIPGFRAELLDHPRADFNRDWLITRVVHTGGQLSPDATQESGADNRYTNLFEAIPSEVPFRPPRETPRPRISGLHTAIVTGPSGEEVHVDEHGRVKVQFHWDRLNPADDSSSCWVRVSQAWAGAGFGAMFLPRVGQEVIVQFIEGDPDRPVVTGRLYNGDNPTPYPLPDHRTRSTIKSNSSPGGGGFNELRFEDKAGSEEIFLHAQGCHNEVVNIHHTESIGGNDTQDVGGDQTLTVKGDRTRTVTEGDETVNIELGNQTVHVGQGNQTIKVLAGSQTLNVEDGQKVTISRSGQELTINGGGQTIKVIGGQDITIASGDQVMKVEQGRQDIEVKGDRIVTVHGKTELTTKGADHKIKSSGTITLDADGGIKITTPMKLTLEGKNKVEVIAPNGFNVDTPDSCDNRILVINVNSKEENFRGHDFSAIGLKEDLVGNAISATVASQSLTLFSLSAGGPSFAFEPYKQKTRAVAMASIGVTIGNGAIHVEASAMVMLM